MMGAYFTALLALLVATANGGELTSLILALAYRIGASSYCRVFCILLVTQCGFPSLQKFTSALVLGTAGSLDMLGIVGP